MDERNCCRDNKDDKFIYRLTVLDSQFFTLMMSAKLIEYQFLIFDQRGHNFHFSCFRQRFHEHVV